MVLVHGALAGACWACAWRKVVCGMQHHFQVPFTHKKAFVWGQVRGEGALPSVTVELPPACAGPGLQFQKTAQVTVHMR